MSPLPPDPHWTAYLTALLTPAVAGVAVWIALRQAKTARAKLKLDLFEKRITVYNEVSECLGCIFRTGDSSSANDQKFLVALHKAKWLFGTEVVSYLQRELWPKMGELHCLSASLIGMQPSEDRDAKIEAQARLKLWFANQSTERMDLVFRPYLSFDKWK